MILDSHRHFWKYTREEFGWIESPTLKRDFLPAGCGEMDDCIAVEARQSLRETEWLLELAREYDFIKGVVGWLAIAAEDFPRQLEKFEAEEKLVGLRHVVQDEPDDEFILGTNFNRGVKHLLSRAYTYDILVFERHLANSIKFVDSHKSDARLVVDHLAKPRNFETWRKSIKELAKRQNVYCKLSGLVTEVGTTSPEALSPYLDTALEAFGANRVMFGSDWPVVTSMMEYDEWKDIFLGFVSRLSADEQTAIMGGNARRFYGVSS